MVEWAFKSLLQHYNLKASILRCSAFFMVQLLHLYMTTTSKTIALIKQTLLGQVTSLLFNRLSRFAIAFLPRSKCLLISWLQSRSTWSPWKENWSLLPLFTFYLPWSDRIMAATWIQRLTLLKTDGEPQGQVKLQNSAPRHDEDTQRWWTASYIWSEKAT